LTTVLGEFDIIARYFAPLANDAGSFELSNDAAVVDLAAGERLVVTLDTLVEGVHYLADDPPGLVARKLLRVNLSDLAAMGARPRGYLLSTALTAALDEAWLGDFTAGLAADQELYSVTLLGGDTVRTPGPVTLSLTGLGTLEGAALARTTAKAGDIVYVSTRPSACCRAAASWRSCRSLIGPPLKTATACRSRGSRSGPRWPAWRVPASTSPMACSPTSVISPGDPVSARCCAPATSRFPRRRRRS
jgi:thiamin-phosphate kinase